MSPAPDGTPDGRPDSTLATRLAGGALLVACASGTEPEGALPVGRCADGRALALLRPGGESSAATVCAKAFSRLLLGPLPAGERNRLSDTLARRCDGTALSRSLHELREGLRERLPRYARAGGDPRELVLDSVLALDERSFYLEGWAVDREAEIARLEAVSPEGERVDLAAHAFRFPLPHVAVHFGVVDPAEARPGFLCFAELEGPSHLDGGWVVEMENVQGECLEAHAPEVLRDRSAARERVLADPARERLPDDDLMESHVRPAIERLQEQAEAGAGIRLVEQFGVAPPEPDVSIVIPLYKRIDLLEEQLAQFVLDSYLSCQDILYVLDSPEDVDELLELASRLHPLYDVPFRVAILKRNSGYANANNAGAGISRTGLLLLMNSDVLPDRPGWLEQMVAFYRSRDGIGALGPKLLYEDDSIQHAGIHFHRAEGQTVWQDAHYFKGLHRDFPDANVPRVVPVVSGACMMIARERYDSMGGLHGGYVQGDYEDADICLRMMEAGLRNWYFPDAELYHLEALSYSSSLRVPANRYNAWLHTRTWGDRIEQLENGV
jgi:GT2 family glycosyltransferase